MPAKKVTWENLGLFGLALAAVLDLSNFLNFFIPVLIFALIAPSIAALGRGAGKWLGVTAGIAYGSTIVAGLLAYVLAPGVGPRLRGGYVALHQIGRASCRERVFQA